jgi:putative heme-binding domain-containing protein
VGGNLIDSADAAEIVLENCSTCHLVGAEGTALGPSLNGVGARIGADGIRSSILDPAAAASPGFEPLQQIMPKDFGSRMSATQLESVVRYLSELP